MGTPHRYTIAATAFMKTVLFAIFGLFTAAFIVFWIAIEARGGRKGKMPRALDCAIGLVTQFFDTLGIGSFATMSAAFKLWGTVPDEHIPGTLNVGVTIPGCSKRSFTSRSSTWTPPRWR